VIERLRPPLDEPIFDELAIIGVGLIGSSIARGARLQNAAGRIVLADRSGETLARAQALALGGNIRVGLEDSLWLAPGRLAKSNAEQVSKARRLIEELGLEPATAAEAREILELKGGDRVEF